jgi:hypothetical protein
MSDEGDDDQGQDQEGGVKRSKHRSPNYPLFGLQKAVERAYMLHEKYKRSLVPINLVQELWGYRPHGGAGNQSVAALKAYGLLDVEGDGKARRVRLTESAYRILMNSPDRADILKKAAVGPPINNELWEKYRGEEHFPDDQLIEHYLLWDRPGGTFNAETVGTFIDNFRGTLRYAGLLPDGIVMEGTPGSKVGVVADRAGGRLLKEGDYAMWTQRGVPQLIRPHRVLGIEGEYAFLEDKEDGVLVNELTAMPPPTTAESPPPAAPRQPPKNPFAAQVTIADRGVHPPSPPAPPAALVAGDNEWSGPSVRFDLPRGNAVEIRLKSKVSGKEFQKLKKIFELSAVAFIEDDDIEEPVA